MAGRAALRVGAVLSGAGWWRRLSAPRRRSRRGRRGRRGARRPRGVGVRAAGGLRRRHGAVVHPGDGRARPRQAGSPSSGCALAGDAGSDARLAAMGIAHRVSDTVAPASMLELLCAAAAAGSVRRDRLAARAAPVRAGRIVDRGRRPSRRRRHARWLVGLGRRSSPASARRWWSTATSRRPVSPAGWVCGCSRTCSTPSTWRRRVVTSGPVLARPAESMPAATLPFDVVAGLPAPSEWQRFSPATADVLLAACQGGWRFTVAMTSPIVEDLRRWVDRYGLSRHLLASSRHRGRGVRGNPTRGAAVRRLARRVPAAERRW